MDKCIQKAVRSDCHRIMWPCYLMSGGYTVLSFLVPTAIAWLVGGMTENLLSLNAAELERQLLPFVLAVLLEAIVLPLVKMGSSLLLIQRGGSYQTQMMGRILRRPLSALQGESGAKVAQHVMQDVPNYYFIQISKCTLPVTVALNGAALAKVLFAGEIPMVFAIAVLLLAGVPLVQAAILGNEKAKGAQRLRDYETDRAKEEETMFAARCFYRLNGLEDICVAGFREHFRSWFASVGQKLRRLESAKKIAEYLQNYGTALGVVTLGAVLVATGRMGVGALMMGYLLLGNLTSFYSAISRQLEDIRQEKDAQGRLSVFYGVSACDLEEIEGNLPNSCPNVEALRASSLSFAYPETEKAVLKNWSGVFRKNVPVCLTGENGTGKTTLVRLLSGLYAPQSGCIADENGKPLSKEMLRRLVTIQEQDGKVFQGTVWENLFAREEQRENARKMLDSLGFDKPLEAELSPEGENLSPGERQKLLFTRAILREGAFLILDEPFNHLDRGSIETVVQQLKCLTKGLILISHRADANRELNLTTADIKSAGKNLKKLQNGV